MMQSQRERLHAALMGPVEKLREDAPGVYRELDELVAKEVETIEPIVDEWILEAVQSGKAS